MPLRHGLWRGNLATYTAMRLTHVNLSALTLFSVLITTIILYMNLFLLRLICGRVKKVICCVYNVVWPKVICLDKAPSYLWGEPNRIDRMSAMLQKIHFGEVGHGAMETWHLQGGHNRGRHNCLSELAQVQVKASERVPGAMVGENWRLLHYQPMDFPSWPVQISNHWMAIRL